MFICASNDAIKNTRINDGTTCVKCGVEYTPNTCSVPSISSTANSTKETINGFHALSAIFLDAEWKSDMANAPAITDKKTAVNCTMP